MTAKKSTILMAVALLLLEASWGSAQSEVILFKLESQAAVYNNPSQRTFFRLDQPAFITKIFTYHWNNGRGAAPGRIGLRNAATGQMVGMWNAVGTYHMFDTTPGAAWPSRGDGPPFLRWTVQPNVNVAAGTYEVVDSDPSTWSSNAEMGNRGCAWVFGSYGGSGYGQVGPSPGATPEVKPTYGTTPANVAGTWSSSDGSIGNLTISQTGSDVTMKYSHSNGRVVGQLRGNQFEGYWMQDFSGRHCSNSQYGSSYWGRMSFTFNGDAFAGKWGFCNDMPGSGFQGHRTGEGYAQAPPNGPFLQALTSGNTLSGEVWETQGPRGGRRWPLQVRITSYDPGGGAIVGELTWPTLGSVHRIRGALSGSTLTFTETEAIQHGAAHLNVSYTLTVSQSSAAGTYVDATDNTSGGAKLTVPPGGEYAQVVPSPSATPEVQPTPAPMPTNVDVNGMWKSGNQTFIFYQEGQTIKVMDTYRNGSVIVVWYGEGWIRGNQVHYRLHHTRSTAPNAEDGIHEFTVSADGNTMNGTWGTLAVPVRGNWSLQRIGP